MASSSGDEETSTDPNTLAAVQGERTIWYLYLIECQNGAYYAGIAKDVQARYRAHERGRGARFTRANPPLRLLAWAPFTDRSSASRAEWQVKQLPRQQKLGFLQQLAEAPATKEQRP